MPLNVFRLYSILPGGSRPGPLPHCNRSRLIAFIVLTGFHTRKLINGASLSPVYFVSACFLPGHLSVCSHFICHNSARYTYFFFFFVYLSPRFSFAFCSPTWLPFCRDKIFPLSVKRIVFISWRSPAIIGDADFTLGTSPISTAPFSRGTARVNTFSSSLSRVIDQQGELRAASGEICRLGERNYDVHGDNPFSPQLLTGNF